MGESPSQTMPSTRVTSTISVHTHSFCACQISYRVFVFFCSLRIRWKKLRGQLILKCLFSNSYSRSDLSESIESNQDLDSGVLVPASSHSCPHTKSPPVLSPLISRILLTDRVALLIQITESFCLGISPNPRVWDSEILQQKPLTKKKKKKKKDSLLVTLEQKKRLRQEQTRE